MFARPESLWFLCIAASGLAGCATDKNASGPTGEPRWAANGWLDPGSENEPVIIGLYESRAECDAAVNDWLSRQVAAHPVRGECLPIDNR